MEYIEKQLEKDKREKNLVITPFHKNIELKIAQLKQYVDEHKIDLEKIFKSHDKNNQGWVNVIQFSYIVT